MEKEFELIERYLKIELKKAHETDFKENDRVKEISMLLEHLYNIEFEFNKRKND